jgi:DNA-binding SARP family transcriptional activator
MGGVSRSGWRIELLGGLRAESATRVVTRFRTQKVASLLAYLAYYHPRTHPRDLLIELLWPEADPDAGRHRLSVTLSSLRQALSLPGTPGRDLLVADHFAVGLSREIVTTDVAEFEAVVRVGLQPAVPSTHAGREGDPLTPADDGRIRALEDAVELYRGPLLPGHYEDWVLSEQRRLEELYFEAIHRLAALLEQTGELERALRTMRRAIGTDPLREESHRELIRLYAATGQPAASLRQYHELERLLQQELGTTPDAATRALADQLAHNSSLAAAGQPSVSSEKALPAALTLNPQPSTLNPPATGELEPPGGAVPLDSPFYVTRPTDD